ncbi:polysaccharide deacetylase family protein [Parabacteroides sp. OttesenSCG-928-G06]|nr:polysaccharide deacetylase family protein [Parabacteroides sp. OttesenSCG-928-G06]
MNTQTLDYIKTFLLGDDVSPNLIHTIGYTNDRNLFYRYKIVIVPSDFFEEEVYGTAASLPTLPLEEIDNVPLLFGRPGTRFIGSTLVVYADIIASAYFLLTRYEEMVRRDIRDEHGRFPGKESLPCRAGFMFRPVVDEYRHLLRKWLREAGIEVPDLPRGIGKVWLTHDVDAPFLYRSWKGFIRSLRDGRGWSRSLKGKFGALENDPYYTFPRFFEEDGKLIRLRKKERCQAVYFIRSGGNAPQDKPHYKLNNRDIAQLIDKIEREEATIGLHTSYLASKIPGSIPKEREELEKHTVKEIRWNRFHFLAAREPEAFESLEAAGITEDFTMGYADKVGFRLGTCRPVRWINPANRKLTHLLLHPLVMMDSTMEEKKYMGLSAEEAEETALTLIKEIEKHQGECVLLWHNTSLSEGRGSYLPSLYTIILDQIQNR